MIVHCARCKQPAWTLDEATVDEDKFLGRMFGNIPPREWPTPHGPDSGLELVCPLCGGSFLDDQHRVRDEDGRYFTADEIRGKPRNEEAYEPGSPWDEQRVIMRRNGKPYATDQAARMTAGRLQLKKWQVIKVRDGYAIATGGSGDMTGDNT